MTACCAVAVFQERLSEGVTLLVGTFLLSFGLYFYATSLIQRKDLPLNTTLWIVLLFAILFRGILLPFEPSSDIYRYLWEGKLQRLGINPYSFPPESPHLSPYRDELYEGINNKHLSTLYPPLALMTFAVSDFLSHSAVTMKLTFITFDLICIFFIIKLLSLKGMNLLNVVIYAWNPLVLMNFAGRGHLDALQMAFVMAALYFLYKGCPGRALSSLTLAVLSKFSSGVMLPFFIQKMQKRHLVILPAILLIAYLPYMGAGRGLFSTLWHFGSQRHYNDSLHALIYSLTGDYISYPIVAGTIIIVVMLYHLSIKTDALRAGFILTGALLVLSPVVHPWYVGWIIPFLCFYPSKAWLLLTCSINLSYINCLYSPGLALASEEILWVKLLEYVPFYTLLLVEGLRDKESIFLIKKKLQGIYSLRGV